MVTVSMVDVGAIILEIDMKAGKTAVDDDECIRNRTRKEMNRGVKLETVVRVTSNALYSHIPLIKSSGFFTDVQL